MIKNLTNIKIKITLFLILQILIVLDLFADSKLTIIENGNHRCIVTLIAAVEGKVSPWDTVGYLDGKPVTAAEVVNLYRSACLMTGQGGFHIKVENYADNFCLDKMREGPPLRLTSRFNACDAVCPLGQATSYERLPPEKFGWYGPSNASVDEVLKSRCEDYNSRLSSFVSTPPSNIESVSLHTEALNGQKASTPCTTPELVGAKVSGNESMGRVELSPGGKTKPFKNIKKDACLKITKKGGPLVAIALAEVEYRIEESGINPIEYMPGFLVSGLECLSNAEEYAKQIVSTDPFGAAVVVEYERFNRAVEEVSGGYKWARRNVDSYCDESLRNILSSGGGGSIPGYRPKRRLYGTRCY